jgi:hypothetical protein
VSGCGEAAAEVRLEAITEESKFKAGEAGEGCTLIPVRVAIVDAVVVGAAANVVGVPPRPAEKKGDDCPGELACRHQGCR